MLRFVFVCNISAKCTSNKKNQTHTQIQNCIFCNNNISCPSLLLFSIYFHFFLFTVFFLHQSTKTNQTKMLKILCVFVVARCYIYFLHTNKKKKKLNERALKKMQVIFFIKWDEIEREINGKEKSTTLIQIYGVDIRANIFQNQQNAATLQWDASQPIPNKVRKLMKDIMFRNIYTVRKVLRLNTSYIHKYTVLFYIFRNTAFYYFVTLSFLLYLCAVFMVIQFSTSMWMLSFLLWLSLSFIHSIFRLIFFISLFLYIESFTQRI